MAKHSLAGLRQNKHGNSTDVSYFDFAHLCALASLREITS